MRRLRRSCAVADCSNRYSVSLSTSPDDVPWRWRPWRPSLPRHTGAASRARRRGASAPSCGCFCAPLPLPPDSTGHYKHCVDVDAGALMWLVRCVTLHVHDTAQSARVGDASADFGARTAQGRGPLGPGPPPRQGAAWLSHTGRPLAHSFFLPLARAAARLAHGRRASRRSGAERDHRRAGSGAPPCGERPLVILMPVFGALCLWRAIVDKQPASGLPKLFPDVARPGGARPGGRRLGRPRLVAGAWAGALLPAASDDNSPWSCGGIPADGRLK